MGINPMTFSLGKGLGKRASPRAQIKNISKISIQRNKEDKTKTHRKQEFQGISFSCLA